jgi:hypothetical protein
MAFLLLKLSCNFLSCGGWQGRRGCRELRKSQRGKKERGVCCLNQHPDFDKNWSKKRKTD